MTGFLVVAGVARVGGVTGAGVGCGRSRGMQVVLARKSGVQFGLIVDRVLDEDKSMECRTRIAVFWYEKEGYSDVISIISILEEHLMSPEVQEHSSSTAMSPASSTSEVCIPLTPIFLCRNYQATMEVQLNQASSILHGGSD